MALALVAIALGPLGQLLASAQRAARAARERAVCGLLAAQKLEQLKSGRWSTSSVGAPLTEAATDFSAEDAASPGGDGLAASPPGSLGADCPGYVDYVDELGRWAGAGPSPPGKAVYTRRWSIEPLPADPANTLVLRVVVFAHGCGASASDPRGPSVPDGARLLTMRTRYSP